MAQRWHHKAGVQAAIAAGVFTLLTALVVGVFGLIGSIKESNVSTQMRALEEQLERSGLLNDPHTLEEKTPSQDDISEATVVHSAEELFAKGATASEAETYYRLGNYYFAEQNYKRAIELYDEAIGLKPNWEKPVLAQGMSYEALGDFANALKAYRQADLTSPHPQAIASVLLNLAATMQAMHRFSEARLHAQRSIAISPSEGGYRVIAESSASLADLPGELDALKCYVELATRLHGRTAEVMKSEGRIEELRAKLKNR